MSAVSRLAAALLESDLIARYTEYAHQAHPKTMRSGSQVELAMIWADRILAADPYLAADIELGAALRATGYVDEHFVTFTESGYGLEHPVRCRPDLIGCQINEWLASQPGPDRGPGRYLMTWPTADGPKYERVPA